MQPHSGARTDTQSLMQAPRRAVWRQAHYGYALVLCGAQWHALVLYCPIAA